MTINQLSATDTLVDGDLGVVFKTSNGDARKASLSVWKSYILDNFMSDLDNETAVVVAALDNFVLYDVSTSNTISINASQVRDYSRDNIFGDMTAGTAVVDADLMMIYEAAGAATKSVTALELQTYLETDLKPKSLTQNAAPSSNGFSVQITDADDNIHLILLPTGTFATGTIVLPLSTNARDKQEVLVNCTQVVSALTIDGNGASAVTGEPTALAANGFFTLKYDLATTTWYRVS